MEEKQINFFNEIENLYDERELYDMRKEFIRNFVRNSLHGVEYARYDYMSLMKLLDFEKSIPVIYGKIKY